MKTMLGRPVFTLLFFLFFCGAQATNYTDNGSATAYNLKAGDTLRIASGTYTGNVSAFNQNAVIIVANSAVFKPAGITNAKGKVLNYGHISLSFALSPNSGFELENQGLIQATGAQLNGAQSWLNKKDATLELSGDLQLNATSVINNYGNLKTTGNLQLNASSALNNYSKLNIGGSIAVNNTTLYNEGVIAATGNIELNGNNTFTNKNVVTLGGTFTANNGTFENSGLIKPVGTITFNTGISYTNFCKMETAANFTNNGILNNQGILNIGGSTAGLLTNSGTIRNSVNAILKSEALINYGTINGNAQLFFNGSTSSTGIVGTSGNTTDSIKVYDATRTNPSKIFDTEWGTIYSNVVYRVMALPDLSQPVTGCSNIYTNNTALPVVWQYFSVAMANEKPVLNWGAVYEAGMYFEVERSFDGISFNRIATVRAEQSADYHYTDVYTDGVSANIYYRIKGFSLDGDIKYSDVKLVQLSGNKSTAFTIRPNPAAGSTRAVYTAAKTELITVRITNVTGHYILVKKVQAVAGSNIIPLDETATLPAGMYVVTITNGRSVSVMQKLVMQ